MFIKGDAGRLPFADRSFDLVVGSPPYLDSRLYLEDGKNLGIARDCRAWIAWMLVVTAECLRVCKGPVLWVCAGKTKKFCYHPAPEGLIWKWWERGGECHCLEPVYWHRVGIPGGVSRYWYRSDVERVLLFKRPGRLPYADPQTNGHPPKWAPGGEMSYRVSDGTRVNKWGAHRGTTGAVRRNVKRESGKRPSHRYSTAEELAEAGGKPGSKGYNPPPLANPGNLLHINVGGGLMGHQLAHKNEAPYPVKLPAFFIRSHCPPGGLVLDPFSGSASTVQAALELGRHAVGCDIRQSQCVLGRQRIQTELPLSAS
jgi:hypothetical protein